MVLTKRTLGICIPTVFVFLPVIIAVLLAMEPTSIQTIRVVAEYPHDKSAFTQGLDFYEGELFEGTGLLGESEIRTIELRTGKVTKHAELPPQLFGEGIVVVDDRVFQLTWKSQMGLIWNRSTFEFIGTFTYSGEGWGLTHDGNHFIRSSGSRSLYFHDPDSFRVVRRISVKSEQNTRGWQLNELEYVNDEIWANVWRHDLIARISPTDGKLLGTIDLSPLRISSGESVENVLNGIAFDEISNKLIVTGKNWNKLFEVEIIEK